MSGKIFYDQPGHSYDKERGQTDKIWFIIIYIYTSGTIPYGYTPPSVYQWGVSFSKRTLFFLEIRGDAKFASVVCGIKTKRLLSRACVSFLPELYLM